MKLLCFLLKEELRFHLKNSCEKNRDLEYLGSFRNFWGYLEISGGFFKEKIENFRIAL